MQRKTPRNCCGRSGAFFVEWAVERGERQGSREGAVWAFPVLTYVFLVFTPAPAWSIAGASSFLDFGNGWNQYHSRHHLSKPGSIFPALAGDGLGKSPP